MFRLVAIFTGGVQVFQVPDDVAKFGADPSNDLVLRVRGISRQHALVRRCPGGIELTDLGSKNGLLVEGRRVERAVLTPGLRIQAGEAWLELQEVSTPSDVLPVMEESPSAPAKITASTGSLRTDESSYIDALRLAYHMDRVGVGIPGQRADLLARLRAALGAEVILTCERQRRHRKALSIRESEGETLSEKKAAQLNTVTKEPRAWPREEVRLKRSGSLLVAGRGNLFLVAGFAHETSARTDWRRVFVRLVAERLLGQPHAIAEDKAAALRRTLELTGGNKSETARRLGISRQAVHNFVRRSPS